MGAMSLWHWVIVGAIVLILFGGRGKISDIMGDFAKGIKSFKKGLSDDEAPAAKAEPDQPAPAPVIQQQAAIPAAQEPELQVQAPVLSRPKSPAKPATRKAAAKPASAKPATAKPAAAKVSASKTSASKPAAAKSSGTKPAASRKKANT